MTLCKTEIKHCFWGPPFSFGLFDSKSTKELANSVFEGVKVGLLEGWASDCPGVRACEGVSVIVFDLKCFLVDLRDIGVRKEEVEGVKETFGNDTDYVGFYSYGEISPLNPNSTCELHNQTMTITTFAEI